MDRFGSLKHPWQHLLYPRSLRCRPLSKINPIPSPCRKSCGFGSDLRI
jgi:hypothetical protein